MKTKQMCSGCRNDFYNGKNDLSVAECWSFADATVKPRKLVHINQMPPWTQKPVLMLSCYHRAQFIVVDGDRTK